MAAGGTAFAATERAVDSRQRPAPGARGSDGRRSGGACRDYPKYRRGTPDISPTAAQAWTDATPRVGGRIRRGRPPFVHAGRQRMEGQQRPPPPRTRTWPTDARSSGIAEHLRDGVGRCTRRSRRTWRDARQQVLAAVNAARAAGFEVGDDLSGHVSRTTGSPSSESAARRAHAESMAREIWQSATQSHRDRSSCRGADHEAAAEIQSLDFGPDHGGLPEEAGDRTRSLHNAEDVHGSSTHCQPGSNPTSESYRRRRSDQGPL